MTHYITFANRTVSSIGFGAMSFSEAPTPEGEVEAHRTLARALELGCTFWDTATYYGNGHNERLIGDFIRKAGCRDQVFVSSKCGLLPDYNVSNSPEHIKEYIERTKAELGFYPDLYYLARIDPNTPLEVSITALEGLRKAGKVKYIGLSECSAATLRKASSIAKIDALQIEYSPFEVGHEKNGLIDTAKELGVTLSPLDPLVEGLSLAADDTRHRYPRFTQENFNQNLKLIRALESIATTKGCTLGQLSIAWVMAHRAIPIPGTRTVKRVEANVSARDVVLTEKEMKEIRKAIEENGVVGDRYPGMFQKQLGH